ncbi:transcription termination factor MTERF6, chloroplastic/mitochondrial-like [Cornus florida]|uniref:transcription termination factor MTERF6, chloroplastic/mitochondrial-like n=1 Tax=Cornus florida TaxID=4283 RepID=UPI0028A07D1C|nr:transcription termination factor MTERF6, chloroplastic/mitochondrial-like [Cornus florida]
MIYMYTKTLLVVRFRCSSLFDSTIHKLYALQTHHPLSSSLKSISTSTNQRSFTVDYLINSCRFSPETAISTSKKINFKTLDQPDSVLNFFKNHGFSITQISTLIRKRPELLLSDPSKTLLPKFDFFYSTGISSTDLANIVSTCPTLLIRSLENYIIPSFTLFINLFNSNDKFIAAVKRFPRIVERYCSAITFSNIEILRQHGVPDSNIVFLLTSHNWSLSLKPDRLSAVVEDVKKMGFNPSKVQFVIAVQALKSMSKTTWKRKIEVYENWGWSEEETMLAFTKYPWCMIISEEKIMAVLNFYVNTMGWESSLIAHRPQLMSFSLGKRIIPRCSVLQVLLSKGLIKKPVCALTLLRSGESLFLNKYVTCYEEAPQLLKLYQEKLHGHES